jgi:hypothetical protein
VSDEQARRDMRYEPIGTVTRRWSTADPPPCASEGIRRTYPDGTSRQWSRRRGGPWQEDAT